MPAAPGEMRAERLPPEAEKPVDVASRKPPAKPKAPTPPATGHEAEGPLLMPIMRVTTRVYVSVSVTTKRRNADAAHAVVPMLPTPPALEPPTITYDEKAVNVSWT